MDFSTVLPYNRSFSVIHLRTNAYQCKPLIISRERPLTLKVKHLLFVLEEDTGRLILGIEVYLYLTFHGDQLEQQFFILKADTTGLGTCRVSVAAVTKAFLNQLISIDPTIYLEGATVRETNTSSRTTRVNLLPKEDAKPETAGCQKPCDSQLANELRQLSNRLKSDPSSFSKFMKTKDSMSRGSKLDLSSEAPKQVKTQISLFTRSANAYLFPHSDHNKNKHVASGDTLFKWWISILDGILDETWLCKADIPGSDNNSVEKFLPRKSNWGIGNIYVMKNSANRAVNTIPLFPDDPKGRFLEHLIVENRYKSMDSDQFWNELGYRQEFRLGNVVGILGCVKDLTPVRGNRNYLLFTIVNPREYKKIRDLIKGEDYRNVDAVLSLWRSGMPELATRMGIALKPFSFVGLMPESEFENKKMTESSSAIVMQNLPERKPTQQIHNLNNLVKRKRK